MKRIALFGGSFDPIHICHELMVSKFLELYDVERLYVVPNFLNPDKDTSFASGDLRLKWCKAVFGKYKNVIVSDIELKEKKPCYTIDTVHKIEHEAGKQRYGKIFLIIGADNGAKISTWKNSDELLNIVEPIVFRRNEDVFEGFKKIDFECPFSSADFRNDPNPEVIPIEVRDEIMNYYKEKICLN